MRLPAPLTQIGKFSSGKRQVHCAPHQPQGPSPDVRAPARLRDEANLSLSNSVQLFRFPIRSTSYTPIYIYIYIRRTSALRSFLSSPSTRFLNFSVFRFDPFAPLCPNQFAIAIYLQPYNTASCSAAHSHDDDDHDALFRLPPWRARSRWR